MNTVKIGQLVIGGKKPVTLQGVINLSPESFFKGSVKTNKEEILKTALTLESEGADIIDIGAMSTAPYLETQITIEEEIKRTEQCLKAIIDEIKTPVSIDTTRATTAEAAINLGAKMINDISGLHDDPKMAETAANAKVPVILGAHNIERFKGKPTELVISALRSSIDKATKAGVKTENIIVDPDIGFHRNTEYYWYQVDSHVLMNLRQIISEFNRPICIGVSRKSFIGHLLEIKDPKDRFSGSLGATCLAVLHGANIVRTHDVKGTKESIRIIEAIKKQADL
ncbi:MAG: dihydropteroate synthase [Candidatus Heimdallarchaeota archaeon]